MREQECFNELDEDDAVEAMLQEYLSSSSEEEVLQWGGSRKGKAPNKERDFARAHQKLVGDYFNGQVALPEN